MSSQERHQAPTGIVGVGDRGADHDGDRRSGLRYDRSQISFSSSTRSRPLSALSEHDIEGNAGSFLKESCPDLEDNAKIPYDFKPWSAGEPYHHHIPQKEDPWNECFKLVLKFDEEMCRGWREEIDTLLVFAGLFSAAVTAFTIESYPWLQADPQITQVVLLQQITAQLATIQSGELNSNGTVPGSTQESFIPSASSVRVNVFWFASLTLSLSAVLIGILCKQWLREYQRYEGLSAKDAFPVRQLRYEGLLGWHVPKILSALPLMLQAALVLFFAGLIDLLWGVNPSVAVCISAIIGLTTAMLIWTTVMPCIQNLIHLSKNWSSHPRESGPQCAFKSPQSWAFYLLITWIISLYSQIKQYLFYGAAMTYLQVQLTSWHSKDANWVKYDYRWQTHGKYVQRGLRWFDKTFARGGYNIDAIYSIYGCLESLEPPISAECVSNIIEENWHPLVPLFPLVQDALASIYSPSMNEVSEVALDISSDLILASYLLVHHKASPRISSRCIEQCARMLYCPSLTKELASFILEALSVLDPTPLSSYASSDIPQVTTALSNLFAYDLISISELSTFWNILVELMKVSYVSFEENSPSLRSLEFLLKRSESWLMRILRSQEISEYDKKLGVANCSLGILEVSKLLKENALEPAAIEDGMAIDTKCLGPFVRLLDETLHSLGGPHSMLSLWSADRWNRIRQDFLLEEVREIKENKIEI